MTPFPYTDSSRPTPITVADALLAKVESDRTGDTRLLVTTSAIATESWMQEKIRISLKRVNDPLLVEEIINSSPH